MTDAHPPGEFSGTARLFPLPNLVLFPNVVQGLHVFEPRYRQLVKDALATDRFITLVLLKPGWEEDYDGAPAIEPVACLGRVTWHEKLTDGRFNLRLRGIARLKIVEEVKTDHLYRVARVGDHRGGRPRRREDGREAAARPGRRGPAALRGGWPRAAATPGTLRGRDAARARSATCLATLCPCRWR